MIETWRDIPGFEGRYRVSDQGCVRSLDRLVRSVSKTGREYFRPVCGVMLRPGKCRGYLIVNLSPMGTIAVHLLVARAFVSGFVPGLEANHKDGIKRNNNALNLEWITHGANIDHAVAIGLYSQAIRVVHPQTGEVFPSIAQAARHAGCRHRTIAKEWARA